MKQIAAAVMATTALLVLAGCGAGPTDKAGATTPITLTLASNDQGTEDIPAVQEFADAVRNLSAGRVRVEIRTIKPAPEGKSDDLNLITEVASGSYDLGWVGTRSMAGAGAPAYAALGTPMLIDSYPLERAVVTDPGVLQALLPSTEATTKVTGLALLADRLRRPYSAGEPLVGPEDYRDKAVWVTLGSVEQEATVAALGARQAKPKPGISLNTSLQDGTTDAVIFDGAYVRDNGMTPKALTANVAFWPRTVLLIGNPAALAKLAKPDRDLVQDAAARAAQASLTIGDDDPQLLTDQCKSGMRAVLADDSQIAALRSAVEPVSDKLAADPATKALIDRIRELKRTISSPPITLPEACAKPSGTESPTAPRATATPQVTFGPTPMDGTYRVEITAADVRAVGFTEHTLPDGTGCPVKDCIAENVGLYTFTFRNGEETGSQRSDDDIVFGDWEGRYMVDGDLVTIVEDRRSHTFRWAKAPDGSLTLTADPKPPADHPGLWYLAVRPLVKAK